MTKTEKSPIRVKRMSNGYYAVQRREGKRYVTLIICAHSEEAHYWAAKEGQARGEEVQK